MAKDQHQIDNKSKRCPWAATDEVFHAYHDTEWGVVEYDSRRMFEFLVLELMQAGLSWRTILLKRESMRAAFAQFVPEKIARFREAKIEKLLQNPGIIRNRLKVNALVNNAKCYLQLEKEGSDFSAFIWQFSAGAPMDNAWCTQEQMPSKTELSDLMSKQLKAYGFKFIGSTICYSFMQAIGMVNDHVKGCDWR
jgi:DNA-3-methyladenine glycosylase I